MSGGDAAVDDGTPLRPLWLSHHYACDVDRCVRFGSRSVCRRCLFITVGLVPAIVLLVSPWGDDLQSGDYGLVLAWTAVAGIEFVQVVTRRRAYSSRRVMALSPAIGAVYAWLAVTGVRDGIGVAHVAFAVAALVPLGILFANGRVVRRA